VKAVVAKKHGKRNRLQGQKQKEEVKPTEQCYYVLHRFASLLEC
jgi:hypothetical protein